ncbi:hypothetical protein [Pseudomonas asiatica]|uniref:hypothetical protein n=1 Tax=Pseudomonas asiatica TaxID=2219225 RepID=UPI000C24095E|nr:MULTISPECIES: hypothetical protein [Pseudomonas]CAB5644028.1 Uncharacterised protein [Pseudomonas putida]PJI70993.1 hypothetical protein CSW00_26025 [Pseudomonas sp. MR 02]CAB5690501.1 Uncharacterised protein [Pseudomonas putida]CAB5717756.1 Uncharacterised protein [Pseudomonas putida]CAB5722738.1 Uncharacterised protein [Pseudomonas putida]
MSDQQLLDLAAKAAMRAGLKLECPDELDGVYVSRCSGRNGDTWNPLEDGGDALRLVVVLRFQVVTYADWVEVLQDGIRMANATSEYFAGCMFATARAAIVRAAAETHRREVEEKH